MLSAAVVQISSLQSGLGTAIPVFASFAAYAVAYCFPDRQPRTVDPGATVV